VYPQTDNGVPLTWPQYRPMLCQSSYEGEEVMSRLPLREATPLRRVISHLATVVLVVLSAGVLLALPATASAHLSKIQKAYFKTMLRFEAQEFTGSVSLLDTWCDTAQMNRHDLEDLINANNPDDKPEIQAYKEWASAFAREVRKKAAADKAGAIRSINKFYAETKPWFKTKSSKRDLREGKASLRGAFSALYEAYIHLGLAAEALSVADFGNFDGEYASAQSARDLALSVFDGGMDQLRGLL
jgi:hypothetical protein